MAPFIVGIVIVGVILIGIVAAQPIKSQLNAWKLLPQPERLTELYFNNSAHLPARYTPGQPQTLSFTVHNLEYRTMSYPYTVTATPDGSQTATPLASGTLKNLSQNQAIATPLNFTLPDLGPRVKVSINLPSVNESIDYWVVRTATPTTTPTGAAQ